MHIIIDKSKVRFVPPLSTWLPLCSKSRAWNLDKTFLFPQKYLGSFQSKLSTKQHKDHLPNSWNPTLLHPSSPSHQHIFNLQRLTVHIYSVKFPKLYSSYLLPSQVHRCLQFLWRIWQGFCSGKQGPKVLRLLAIANNEEVVLNKERKGLQIWLYQGSR